MMGGRGMVMGRKRPWGDQWDCGPPTFHGNKYPRFKCPVEDELEILARRQMALMRRRVMLRRMEMMEDRQFLSGPDFRLSPDMLEFPERGFLGPPRPLRPPDLLGPLEPLEPYGLLGPPEPLGPFDPLERPGPVRPPEPLGPFDPLERPLGCSEAFDPLGRPGGLEPPGPMGSRRGHRGGFPGNYDVDTMRDFGEDGAEFSREMRPGGFRGRGFHCGFGPNFQGGNGGRKGDGGMDEGMGVFEQERGGGPFDEFGNQGLGSGGNVDRGGFEREGRWEKRGASHWRGREKEEGKSDHGRKQGRETSRHAKKVGKIEGSYGDKSEGNSNRQWPVLFGDSMPDFADTFKNGTAGEREENQTVVEPGSSDSKAVEAATGKASADGDKALGAAQRNHCTYGDKSDSNSRRRWALLLGDSMPELSGMFGEKKTDLSGKTADVDRPHSQNSESKHGWKSGQGSCRRGGRSGNHGGLGGSGNWGVFSGSGNRGGFDGSGNRGGFGGSGNRDGFDGSGNRGGFDRSGNCGGFGGSGNRVKFGGIGNRGEFGGHIDESDDEDDIGLPGTGAFMGVKQNENGRKETKGKKKSTPVSFFIEKNSCTYGGKSDSNSRRRWAMLCGGEPNPLEQTLQSRIIPRNVEEQVDENPDFDEKMKRLKATIPLQSLVDRSKLMREKLVTVEDFRNLVGNSKNIKAFCYFVRFTDPSDPTVRVVECQLYVENVFISSAKTKIARCSMLDLSEPVWKRSPEKQDVLNDAYIRAWETFNSKTVNDICTSHRILREGEVPEGTFSYVGHGDGKFSPTNIASLVRMKHPYKPSIRSSLSDLILMSSDDATSFQILRRSCNQSGLLLEMESQLKQFLTTNTIICKLYIAKKFIAQGKGGSKEAAWVDCSNSALEKLKKTKSYIKIKPNTSKEPLMTWEVFKAQAESWYTAQGLPDPTPDKPDPNPDISVAEETPQKTNEAVTENPYPSEPSNNNVTSGTNTKSEAPVVAYTTRKGLAAAEITQPMEPTVSATVSSTSNNLTTPGVGVYNSETAGGNTAIQTSSQYSFDYTNYNPQFSFVYDAQGYCYILDSSGQYTPYTAQAHAMYYNMYSGQYGQASTGQYTVPGSENYSTQTFGQYGTWGTDGNANPLGGYGQTPGTQMQTTTAQPPATPPTKGRWDLSVKVPKTMSEAKTAQNYRNCNDTKGQRKAHRLLSSGVLVPRKGKFIHWREPLAPVNKKVLMYLEDRLIKRRKVDTLEEMYICSGMPLAERQALENLCLKYDFKLIMHGADHKISVIRWFSAQETFACLKRNNNVSGRTILVAEKGVPTGLE